MQSWVRSILKKFFWDVLSVEDFGEGGESDRVEVKHLWMKNKIDVSR